MFSLWHRKRSFCPLSLRWISQQYQQYVPHLFSRNELSSWIRLKPKHRAGLGCPQINELQLSPNNLWALNSCKKKLMDKANLCSPTQELLMFQICSSKFKNTYSQVNYIKQNCIASLHQVILVTRLDSHLVLFICQHQSENKNLTTEYTLRNDLMMKYDNANCSSSNILLYCSV